MTSAYTYVGGVHVRTCLLDGTAARVGLRGRVAAVNAKSAALRDEVLALPTEERAVLAVELLASLDADASGVDPGEVDRAWAVEMVRRSEQISSGEVRTVGWADVLNQVAASRNSQ
jgi:putative addiction module component (TIGR02574 family)